MKKIFRVIKSVRRMLFLNPMRVALSLSGIAIGIASVIIMFSLGEGARSRVLSKITAMGSNVITVDAGLVKEVAGRTRQANKVITLKEKDAQAILEECSAINAVAPTQEKTLIVKYDNGSTIARIIGTYPEFPVIRNFQIEWGRFFSEEDNRLSLRYAVIGNKFVNYLFKDTDPIGAMIKINNIPFEVIGVLKSKGSSYDGANEDDMIFIPLNTGMRRVFNVNYLKNIYVKVKSRERIQETESELRNLLRQRHRLNIRNKEDDFFLQNVYTAMKVENETNETFTILITAVGALSLLVGGIGILATMILSVKERKPEIGLRMAVGAKAKDILLQFLAESIILSFAGGIAGIIAGTAGAYLVGSLTDFAVLISLRAALLSLAISLFIGIFFGVSPARRASLTQPVNALKP